MKDTTRIAVFDSKGYDISSFNTVNQDFGFALTYYKERLSPETLTLARDFDCVCIFVNDVVDQGVIDGLSDYGIKLIALRCAGYNNVDLKKVFGRLHVVRVPAYSPYAVAEHTVALMLTLNRKIHKAYNRTRESNFTIDGLLGFDMHGKTAGIIGTGKIGRSVIEILTGFGMKILAHDLNPDQESAARIGFSYVDLNTIYHESDVISLHCPLTPENMYLINRDSIAKMKAGVMLINTGRGKLIDTRALIHGLKTKKVGSAGLDVYEEETDYFFEDFSGSIIDDDVLARLLTFPNVVITAHQAFFTAEALEAIARTTFGNIKAYFSEQKLENEICYKCGRAECQKKTDGRCF